MTYSLTVSIVLRIYFLFNLTDDADHKTNDVNYVITAQLYCLLWVLDINRVKVLRLSNQSNKSRPIK